MGFRNFGSLLIIFFILMMVFGTHKLRSVGNDLAVAIRSFRKGLQEDDDNKTPATANAMDKKEDHSL